MYYLLLLKFGFYFLINTAFFPPKLFPIKKVKEHLNQGCRIQKPTLGSVSQKYIFLAMPCSMQNSTRNISSLTRDQSHDPSVEGWNLNHWTTREVLGRNLWVSWRRCRPFDFFFLRDSGNSVPFYSCTFLYSKHRD